MIALAWFRVGERPARSSSQTSVERAASAYGSAYELTVNRNRESILLEAPEVEPFECRCSACAHGSTHSGVPQTSR